MPIRRTTDGGKPAYQWGDTGKKYTYKPNDVASRESAKKKAIKQGLAAAYQMKTKPDL
jgi:hypothetical protein